ncbi:MAG: G8 domain-containing protein [Verrucomicrobiota bacterium]
MVSGFRFWPCFGLGCRCAVMFAVVLPSVSAVPGDKGEGSVEDGLVRSVASGAWSEPETWSTDQVPQPGSRVQIREGHRVRYDVESSEAIRAIHVAGTLAFATDRDTRLDVGLIRIERGDEWKEGGFDCHYEPGGPDDSPQPALQIGTALEPVGREHRALVRLVYFEGDDEESLPAIVCFGGRMDIHGAPLERTWVKLGRTASVNETRLFLDGDVSDWRAGDRIVITATDRQRPVAGVMTPHVTDKASSEERTITQVSHYASSVLQRSVASDSYVTIDAPLVFPHRAEGGYAGEVANLSRNVIIESADPEGPRGHTMYHRHSAGSISYAEFRHLGKEGLLGRYPIHYHLVGDSMRGSSIIGASIWDSDNRWVTIHGTQYLVVRDCVGYRSVGHGYFMEDGTEVFNVLDRNLAIQALVGKPLPRQDLPYDRNDGAGFWWANSLNAFTRNVAVECDQHGFRFEVEATEDFDPVLDVLRHDGTTEAVDIRTLPFIRFDDNEAHAQRRFALNLGGIRGKTMGGIWSPQPYSVGGHVDGVGPDAEDPFIIRNFKAWDSHWCFHGFAPSVYVDGMDLYDSEYGIWRSVVSLHFYENLKMDRLNSGSISFPMGGYGPKIGLENGRPNFPVLKPTDERPPVTVITRYQWDDDGVSVWGTSVDNEDIKEVRVNGVRAEATRDNFAEWTAIVPTSEVGEGVLSAYGEDVAGNRESLPHEWILDEGKTARGQYSSAGR